LAQEHVSRIIARERALPLRIGRIFNVVGPGQDERHAAGRFCSQISAAIAGTSEGKIVVGDLTPTRDFVDVRDTASGLIAIANPTVPNDTYNIASGTESSIQIVLDSLLRIGES
jgi:GDP-4-dehydro-6-deoxy-D-mannose reductase